MRYNNNDMANHLYLEKQLKALSNRRRIAIIAFLKKKHNASVSEMALALGVSQQALSRHLSILKSADIVDYTRRGNRVSYRLQLSQSKEVQSILKGL